MLGGDLGGLPAGAELDAGAFVLCERLPRAAYGVCVPSAVRPPTRMVEDSVDACASHFIPSQTRNIMIVHA